MPIFECVRRFDRTILVNDLLAALIVTFMLSTCTSNFRPSAISQTHSFQLPPHLYKPCWFRISRLKVSTGRALNSEIETIFKMSIHS